MEIMYDQGSEFIGHEFRKHPIEKEHWDKCQTKHFRKYYFQCDTVTD